MVCRVPRKLIFLSYLRLKKNLAQRKESGTIGDLTMLVILRENINSMMKHAKSLPINIWV